MTVVATVLGAVDQMMSVTELKMGLCVVAELKMWMW